MDNLPFIDPVSAKEEYRQMAEKLFAEELLKQDTTQKHPEVIKILNSTTAKTPGVFSQDDFNQYKHVMDNGHNPNKRPRESIESEDIFLNQYKAKHPHIDMSLYDSDQQLTDTAETKDRLAIVDSYLSHQLIALRDLIPKTMVNQWAINNDLMRASVSVVDDLLEVQRKQLEDLDKYRKHAQTTAQPSFNNLEHRINDMILDEIERRFPQQGN